MTNLTKEKRNHDYVFKDSEGNVKGFFDMGNANDDLIVEPNLTKEKWEIIFDKEVERADTWGGGKFGALDETWDGEEEGISQFTDWDGVKKFIRTTIQEAKAEERERQWEMMMDCLPKDAENLSLLTDDQAGRLMRCFIKKYPWN